jgi:hypothetical protein
MIIQKSLRYGLQLGLGYTAYSILSYASNINPTIQSILGLIVLILIIALWIVFATRVRRANNESFTYGEAFTSLFFIALPGIVLSIIWSMILLTSIDPELIERTIETAAQAMETFNKELTPEMIEEMRKGATILGQIQALLIYILFMSAISALVALVIKKEASPFASSNQTID